MSSDNPNDQKPAVPPESDDLLVSDAERELALGRLREGYVEGRITLDEYSARLDRVLDARTETDLQAATQGLPAVPGSAPVARPTGPTQPAPERIVSVMSDTRRQGRWLLSRPMSALAIMSSLRIDLRDSQIPQGEVDLTVYSIMADVKVFVPAGVEVILDELTLMGAQQDKRSAPPPSPGAPVVRLRGLVLMGSVQVLNDEPGFFARVADHLGGLLGPPPAPGQLPGPGRPLTPHEELIARHIERRLERWERRQERRDERRERRGR